MLSGVVVLELGQVVAGNYGGVILADMGAEVIKIEPLSGDLARNPNIAPLDGESSIHLFMNRNKKSVALNLKDPTGLQLFYRLVEKADVVVDNFRPGVMARLGIDHETLKCHNPKVITVSVTGFGEYGPSRNRPAFDLVVQAFSGLLHITGDPDGPPSRVGIPIADIAGGIFACISVLGALVGRELHDNGQHVDVGMLDSLVSMLSYDALHHLNSGEDVTRYGTAHAHMVPWEAFEVKDGYVVVAAREEKFWLRLCDAIERPGLKDDPRAIDNATRVLNRSYVVPILAEAFAQRTKAEWTEIFNQFDIPAAPVNDFAEVFADPQVNARGIVRDYDHATLGKVRYPASPMQFSDWQFPNLPAPMLGAHTAEVLGRLLDYNDEAVADLAAAGIVRVWPEADSNGETHEQLDSRAR